MFEPDEKTVAIVRLINAQPEPCESCIHERCQAIRQGMRAIKAEANETAAAFFEGFREALDYRG